MFYKWVIIGLFCFCNLFVTEVRAQLTYKTLAVEFDSGWTYKNLTLIPIRFRAEAYPLFYFPAKIISLREALQNGKLKIKELYFQNDAQVRTLSVENTGDNFVLIEDGEIISGGKQDRMIAESKIIYPKEKDQFISVFCIEQNRWNKRAKQFKYAGNGDDDLKKIMDLTNQQQFIWREIDRRLTMKGQVSKTSAYLELNNTNPSLDTGYINFFTRKMQASDSLFAGFIAITDTAVINCEVFGSTTLTTTSFNNMLSGWVSSALFNGKKPNVPFEKLKLFTDALFENEDKQKIFLQKHGKAFFCEKQIFHIVAHG